MRLRWLCAGLCASGLFLGPLPLSHGRIGGLAGGVASDTPTTAVKGGYFDGQDYQLGLYLRPQIGYESNVFVRTDDVEGSALAAIAADAELRYRLRDKLRLRGELSAGLRLPFADSALTEFLLEVPVFALYRLTPQIEIGLANHLGIERSKTPPVFLPAEQAALAAASGTIRYLAFYETIRAAATYHASESIYAEAGPYFRVKQVTFSDHPPGADPDYRLFDVGVDVALKLHLDRRFSARLHYDLARRLFSNYLARPPAFDPAKSDELAMTRHIAGLTLRGRLFGPLQAAAGYSVRINRDNGGNLDYVDHMPMARVSALWTQHFTLTASVSYLLRRYTSRTPCTAAREGELFTGSDCSPVGGDDPNLRRQSARENGLLISVSAALALDDWIEVVFDYEIEDADADTEDPLHANHRILTGASFNL